MVQNEALGKWRGGFWPPQGVTPRTEGEVRRLSAGAPSRPGPEARRILESRTLICFWTGGAEVVATC